MLTRLGYRSGSGGVVARRWWVWGAAAALVLLCLVVWSAWPREPRARPYLDYTACLLTDAQGPAGPVAGPAWAGMRDASRATHARVQYQQVTGEPTVGNAMPYLASLLQRRCAVVVAVGAAQVAAVDAEAAKHPGVRFATVGGTAARTNVTVLAESPDALLRDRIRRLVTEAVRSASPR
jgi:hypothetical protein